MVKPLRVLVCGVPNVGKSTLVNTLMRRKATKTGDEAGITQVEQVLSLASDVLLYDTPGMLWPRISVPQSGLHLAASGAVGRNAYDEQEVALALLQALQAGYAADLARRYKQPEAGALSALPADELLALVARQRGLVQSGARLNLQQAAEAVLNDFRSGAIGRITLETPDDHAPLDGRRPTAGGRTRGCAQGQGRQQGPDLSRREHSTRQPQRGYRLNGMRKPSVTSGASAVSPAPSVKFRLRRSSSRKA